MESLPGPGLGMKQPQLRRGRFLPAIDSLYSCEGTMLDVPPMRPFVPT
jgi:hypothetical protein